MTTILAVEPDPRQASRLSTVLRGRRNTDVVIARSVDNAIESIAGRVPDVLLTSQLLSPQDEARLASWLKELGPAASRVQALTIPILAPKAAAPQEPQRGLLAGLRRRGSAHASHGCESKIFAEHVAAYLDRNVIEEDYETAPATLDINPVLPPPVPETIAPAPIMIEPSPGPIIAESTPDAVVTEVRVADPVLSSALEEDEGLWLLTRSPQVIEFRDEAPAADHDTAPLGLPPAPQMLMLPREVRPVAPFEVVFELPEVITVRDDSCETVARRPSTAAPVKPIMPAKPTKPAPADDSALNITAQVQDEWGFFDPSKCGFAALLEKLDEISDEDRQSSDEVESNVRIVSHY